MTNITSQSTEVELDELDNKVVESPGRLVLKRFLRNKLAIVGLVIIVVMAIFTLIGPIISPYGEFQIFYAKDGVELKEETDKIDFTQPGITLNKLQKPDSAHILGTDRDGRDIFTRLMYGGRISLRIGFIVVIMQLAVGVFLGGLAGYYRKWVDNLIMRLVDIFFCIPTLPVMLILASIMLVMKVPPDMKIYVLMLVLAFFGWAGVARLVRGQILALRDQEYMVATEAVGLRPMRRIFRHLIPNVMPQLIVMATLGLGGTILTESALSYLGMGVSFPYASWGNMVNTVTDPIILSDNLHVWVPPGACIFLTVFGFNLIGDGLRDAFDPKMKR